VTLRRTIKRREMRRRAKRRQGQAPGPSFATLDWVVRQQMDLLRSRLTVASLVNRQY